MGFFEAIGNGAKRTQLRAEVQLVEREITTRKKAFGVELFDLIALQTKREKNSMLKVPGLFKTIENTIQVPLDQCTKDVELLDMEKRQLEDEVEVIEAKRDRDINGGLGKKIADGAREGQIAVKVALLNRDMKIRKEKFGLEVYDIVSQPQWLHDTLAAETKKAKGIGGAVKGGIGGLAKGVKGTVGKTLGKVSGDERTIEECVQKAKAEIDSMERRKQIKQTEISNLS